MMDLRHIPNQRDQETVKMHLRRFWLAPVGIVFYTTMLYLLPGIAAVAYHARLTTLLAQPLLGPVTAIIICMYILGVWLFGFLEFTDYYLDVWIVTNERIINIEQKGLFTRVASELHLAAIQDATSEVSGPLHTFLDYGNVVVETAAEKIRFVFREVPKPESVKEIILELVEQDKKRHNEELAVDIAEQGGTPQQQAQQSSQTKTGPV